MFSNSKHVGIFGGTFTNYTVQHQHHHGPSVNIQSSKKSAINRLMEASSLGALHNSGERFDPPKCHPNTRTAVLQKLMDWFIGKDGWDGFVLWLYGPACAGKSAIAQTFAEQCCAKEGLLASFFFSRSDAQRNNGRALAATLAYQISIRIPGFWDILGPTIDRDPAIFQLNFETQFQTLILRPLLQLADTGLFTSGGVLPYLFVIDGLDKCNGPDIQENILRTISAALQHHRMTLPFKFLITSRPEYHLTNAFSDVSLHKMTFRLALDDTYKPDKDIKLYLMDSFHNIRKTHIVRAHLPDSWPSGDDIAKLVAKSSGQFIYAATVIHGLRPVNNDKPYTQLDALYVNILSSVEDVEATLRVLGISLVLDDSTHTRIPVIELEKFMLLVPGSIELLLLDLPSVVDTSDINRSVKFLHASFTDFLFDPTRSLQFYIDRSLMHEEAARLCITHINSSWSSYVSPGGRDLLRTVEETLLSVVEHLERIGLLQDNLTLREAVLKMSYIQSFMSFNSHPWEFDDHSFHAGKLLLNLLNFLPTSDFWNPQELYLQHRSVWDQIMHNDLATVPESRGLAFWTACLATLEHMPDRIYFETVMALISSPEAPEVSLYVPLSFFTGETHDRTVTFDGVRHRTKSHLDFKWLSTDPDYNTVLKDFLTDPSRAGPYVATESTYIMVAEFVIAFAVRPWDKKKRMDDVKDQWNIIWDALVSFLSRARRSNELVKLLSQGNTTFYIGIPFKNARRRLLSMYRAVSDYLHRCTGSIPAASKTIIDWTLWNPEPYIK